MARRRFKTANPTESLIPRRKISLTVFRAKVMEEKLAQGLLVKVKKDYDLTVDDYTRSRAFIPEDIVELTNYAVAGDKILDSGCASGRLCEIFLGKNADYFGVDLSEKMIDRARADHPAGRFQASLNHILYMD